MEQNITNYRMFREPDIAFVKCTLKQPDGAPTIIVLTKEPNKTLRVIPFYDESKFNEFVLKFMAEYKFSRAKLMERMLNTIFIDDEHKEYRIICGDKSVSFTVDYDALRGESVVTRSDFNDYPQIEL